MENSVDMLKTLYKEQHEKRRVEEKNKKVYDEIMDVLYIQHVVIPAM